MKPRVPGVGPIEGGGTGLLGVKSGPVGKEDPNYDPSLTGQEDGLKNNQDISTSDVISSPAPEAVQEPTTDVNKPTETVTSTPVEEGKPTDMQEEAPAPMAPRGFDEKGQIINPPADLANLITKQMDDEVAEAKSISQPDSSNNTQQTTSSVNQPTVSSTSNLATPEAAIPAPETQQDSQQSLNDVIKNLREAAKKTDFSTNNNATATNNIDFRPNINVNVGTSAEAVAQAVVERVLNQLERLQREVDEAKKVIPKNTALDQAIDKGVGGAVTIGTLIISGDNSPVNFNNTGNTGINSGVVTDTGSIGATADKIAAAVKTVRQAEQEIDTAVQNPAVDGTQKEAAGKVKDSLDGTATAATTTGAPANAAAVAAADATVTVNVNDNGEKKEGEVPAEKTEAEKKAEEFAGPLSDEAKKAVTEAGKDEKGFMNQVKRLFQGKTWNRVWSTLAGSLGSIAGVGAVNAVTTGAVLAFGGPATIAIGGALAVMGVITLAKTAKNVREAAKAAGKSSWEMMKDKDFLKGALVGGGISGTLKGIAMFVPGLGPLGAMLTVGGAVAAETIISVSTEKNLNKKQAELVDKMMDSFGQRRYKVLKDKGYVIRGAEGAPGVSVDGILKDMTDAKLTAGERKTAVKSAITTLQYAFEQTKDTKYQFVEYTVKENGKDVKKTVDVTKIGLKAAQGSTDEYPTLELGDPNIEAIIDTINVAKLNGDVADAWGKTTGDKKTEFAKTFVSRFVGIEAADVDKLLSEERKEYLKTIAFTTGFHAGTGIVNGIITVSGGASTLGKGFSALGEHVTVAQGDNLGVDTAYRHDFNSPNATVVTLHDASGHTVDSISLNGNASTPDIIHVSDTNNYIVTTTQGAEHVFEMQHPNLGDVSVHEISHITNVVSTEPNIMGTFTDASGHVVGVISHDTNGYATVMDTDQLAKTIHVNGGTESVTLTDIQADGHATAVIAGHNYNVDLNNLGHVGDTGSTLHVGGEIPIQQGDSVNSMLHKTMAEAKLTNPNLAKYDNLQLERMLFQGQGNIANDHVLRQEMGLRLPLDAKHDHFDVSKSPTIIHWLEQLNGGPVNLSAGSTTTTPGSGYDLTFNPGAITGIDVTSTTATISGEGVPMDVVNGTAMLAGLAGAAIATFMDWRTGSIGGITRSTELNNADSKAGGKGDGILRETTVTSTESDKEAEKKYSAREIILKQVLPGVQSKKFITIGNKAGTYTTYLKSENKEVGWTTRDGKQVSAEQITDELLALSEADQLTSLRDILQNGSAKNSAVDVSKEVGYIKVLILPKPGSSSTKTFVNWAKKDKDGKASMKREDNIQSSDLAKQILAAKAVTTTTTTAADGTTAPAGGEARAETILGDVVDSENNGEKFKGIAQAILNQLHADKKSIQVDGVKFSYDAAGKIWNAEKKGPSFIKSESLMFKDAQIIDVWQKQEAKSLSKDLTYTLNQIDGNKKLKVTDKMFNRVVDIDYFDKDGVKLDLNANPGDYTKIAKTVEKKNFWQSKDEALNNQQLAEKIIGTLEASKTVKTENKDNVAETKEKAEKEKKESFGRKLLKAAIIVGAVIGGGVVAASGAGIPVAIGTGIGVFVSHLIRVGSDRYANSKLAEQAKIYEANKDKPISEADKKRLEELKKKEERARKFAGFLGGVNKYAAVFGISAGVFGIFGPMLQSLEITAKLQGLINSVNVVQTPHPFVTTGGISVGH